MGVATALGFRIKEEIRMLRDVVQSIDYSFWAEVALTLFCVAFALMTYAVIRLKPSSSQRFASIPLSDSVEDPRDE